MRAARTENLGIEPDVRTFNNLSKDGVSWKDGNSHACDKVMLRMVSIPVKLRTNTIEDTVNNTP